jgi:F0F1-type ATP synthase delta subunit
MFHVSSWARMFLAVTETTDGKNAKEAFLCLKALALPIKPVSGIFFGHDASEKLEKVLRESVTENRGEKTQPSIPMEYAIRFICLLVEKHSLKYIDLILSRIESMLNGKNGILDLDIESAAPVENDLIENFERLIKEKTGAAGVNIKTYVKPELLGGYLLRTNGFYIDATLKGQADKMMSELSRLDGCMGG